MGRSDVPLAPAAVPVTPVAVPAAPSASDAATVKVEQGLVRFYFAPGNASLAAGAAAALDGVIEAGKNGRQIAITGFHDPTGDAIKNAALARQRAMAVREALRAAGVPDAQIAINTAEQTGLSGDHADARRVDIRIQ
jgi:outer membrane protein OmpA-like peptidoglycan-associated protein